MERFVKKLDEGSGLVFELDSDTPGNVLISNAYIYQDMYYEGYSESEIEERIENGLCDTSYNVYDTLIFEFDSYINNIKPEGASLPLGIPQNLFMKRERS